MSKLKSDVSDNKRLKANNLRKIVNSITDYTNDVIGLQLVDFTMPDTNRAAEGNIQDVGRIIQVITNCLDLVLVIGWGGGAQIVLILVQNIFSFLF